MNRTCVSQVPQATLTADLCVKVSVSAVKELNTVELAWKEKIACITAKL